METFKIYTNQLKQNAVTCTWHKSTEISIHSRKQVMKIQRLL